eukprot:TRINITY_DN1280_c0_g1_i2.p1 TRINITY_DN1280_c0_g1~~TRINITY_DN1280_c0_g1_i2.p1  ORF type:complete len:350 (+),score=71.84 TRINITY_DN1280_c0_g1_i2:40-1089(+)
MAAPVHSHSHSYSHSPLDILSYAVSLSKSKLSPPPPLEREPVADIPQTATDEYIRAISDQFAVVESFTDLENAVDLEYPASGTPPNSCCSPPPPWPKATHPPLVEVVLSPLAAQSEHVSPLPEPVSPQPMQPESPLPDPPQDPPGPPPPQQQASSGHSPLPQAPVSPESQLAGTPLPSPPQQSPHQQSSQQQPQQATQQPPTQDLLYPHSRDQCDLQRSASAEPDLRRSASAEISIHHPEQEQDPVPVKDVPQRSQSQTVILQSHTQQRQLRRRPHRNSCEKLHFVTEFMLELAERISPHIPRLNPDLVAACDDSLVHAPFCKKRFSARYAAVREDCTAAIHTAGTSRH